MVKKYLQLQQKLTFDELMTILSAEFEQMPDHRVGNATKYVLADVLKSAFAMFSLKCPSLLDFKQQSLPEQSNLRSIYQVAGAIPCDNQMRGMLDPLAPESLRALFRTVFLRLRHAGLRRAYQYWHDYVVVSADGGERFPPRKSIVPIAPRARIATAWSRILTRAWRRFWCIRRRPQFFRSTSSRL